MSTHRPCKKCGEPIHFVPTSTGKLMPCELNIVTIITTNGIVSQGYIPHWDKSRIGCSCCRKILRCA